MTPSSVAVGGTGSPYAYHCKDDDNLWLTFFHDVAHNLLPSTRAFIVDDTVGDGVVEREVEADNSARNLLIPSGSVEQEN